VGDAAPKELHKKQKNATSQGVFSPLKAAKTRELARKCASSTFGAVRKDNPMPMQAVDIERLIKAHIPDAVVTIQDLAGDGDHYAATVLSEAFRGKSRLQQHQLVYAALKAEMGGTLHALALQTGLPER
jgi:stress-induced morphogen